MSKKAAALQEEAVAPPAPRAVPVVVPSRAWDYGVTLGMFVFAFLVLLQIRELSREQDARFGHALERLALLDRNIVDVSRQLVGLSEGVTDVKTGLVSAGEFSVRFERVVADLAALGAGHSKLLDEIKSEQNVLSGRFNSLEGQLNTKEKEWAIFS